MSVSDSCFQAGMAPRPLSTTWISLPLSASSTTGEPSSALMGPAPLPLAWWQAAQLAAYTDSPRLTKSASVHTLLGSSAAAAMALYFSPTQAVYSSADTTFTWMGM